jgi:hypothetical protein
MAKESAKGKGWTREGNFSRYVSVLSEGFTDKDATPPWFAKQTIVKGLSDTMWRQESREKKGGAE